MAATASMTIHLDPEVKARSQELFKSLGMDMTTAINIFLRQALMQHGLPFEVKTVNQNKLQIVADDDLDAVSAKFMQRNRHVYEELAK